MKKILLIFLTLLTVIGCSDNKKRQQFLPSVLSTIIEDDSSSSNSTRTEATLTAITVQPGNSVIASGTTQSYTATGVYSDGSYQDLTSVVTWSTGSNSIASNSGQIVTGVSAGTTTVIATVNSLSGEASVTVSSATLDSIRLEWVSTMGVGSTMQLVALGVFSDGSIRDISDQVTWSSGSTGIATINSTGLATAVSSGTSSVTASLGGVTSSAKNLVVTSSALTSISIGADATIPVGASNYYTATATYADGSTQDVTNSVTWSSSNTSATNSGMNGTLNYQVQGTSAGTSTISASLNGITGSANLTVSSLSIVSITITGTGDGTVAKGTTRPLTATATLSDGSTMDVTSQVSWVTNNTSTATASNATGMNGTIYGVNEGSVTVTASMNGISGTANLTVTAATLVSINIGSDFNITKGTSNGLVATGTYSDGTTQDITSLVTWASANTSAATVSNSDGTNGTAYGVSAGTASISASYNGVTSNSVTATVSNPTTGSTSSSTVSGYDVTVPSTMTVNNPGPSGDFSGITYQGNPSEVAGFVSTVEYTGTAGCTAFGAALVSAMASDNPDNIASNIQISKSTIGTDPDCSSVYLLGVTTNSSMTVTELSNHLITVLGTSVPGGTVSSFPTSGSSEVAGTDFRVILQATYSSTGNELVGIGVSRTANYADNEAILNSLLDGTNILATGTTKLSKTDTFTGATDPKVDFVWVVDNSGSMSGEQSSVQSAATTFFAKLANKHLDYRLAVLATGSDGSGECNTDLSTHPSKKAWVPWGTGWTTSSDGETSFTDNISSVGLNGCGKESGAFFAKYGLEQGTVVTRSGAKIVVIFVTDEGDHYNYFTGGTLNSSGNANPPVNGGTDLIDYSNGNSNYYKTNNIKVYSIIGLDNTTSQPGTCTGSGSNSANTANNPYPLLYDLAASTGGSSASICTDDFSSIMESITSSVAAASSSYVLSQQPLSSTIAVTVNGIAVTQDSTNGWSYNSSSNSIVFSGTAWPASGAAIEVSYEYASSSTAMGSGDSSLTAYLFKASGNKSVRIGFGVILLAGLALIGRMVFRKNED